MSRRRIDLVGKRFGRWRVRAYVGGERAKWSCVCDCDTYRDVRGDTLRRGISKSCGCLARELSKIRATTHGLSGSREYSSWTAMKSRCLNPNAHAYDRYGALGIRPCDRWSDDFIEFFADSGTRPDGYTLHRFDPTGNYEPGNCGWADIVTQNRNRRKPRKRAARPKLPPLDDPPF